MPAAELASRYNSKDVESKWYAIWEKQGYFAPKRDPTKKPFVIVIPPPNVTGILHMGHALNNTIQDILIRWKRMQGNPTLWVPGVDHAGIATQNVVEKKLAKEGRNRHQLGREKFVAEVWKWKNEYGSTIVNQLRRLGASCDWTRERFTMDEGLSRAVREAFVTLYERGLIYRGDYIINWCPRCQTALSDEEAVHQEIEGALYYIKYPIAPSPSPLPLKGERVRGEGDEGDYVVVATTRPETMLGDTAVAINPKDERYSRLRGKKVLLPLLKRVIPVIEDEFVDPEFGTGIVKVTPAHDPNDFLMGRRHKLPFVNVLYPDGTINENGGPYHKLDRFEARKCVLYDLQKQGLFEKSLMHQHAVGHCYRCHTIVEPYLSKQWFVKMKPLAEKALKAHREEKVKFYPERWNKVYTKWLENIRDWCISRQIWWGHQLPVWYCDKCVDISSPLAGEDKGGGYN
ncbi:MAG: valine--tRNA ligase, partial [Candidatus Omnitrophica bacterium]|nr:valine--tRNA ligase [Candidatus Omnitrophota bacterium]